MYIKTKLQYNKSLFIGFFIFSLVILLAVFSPYITTYDPLKIDVVNRLKLPNNEHLLGTDELGRDVLRDFYMVPGYQFQLASSQCLLHLF